MPHDVGKRNGIVGYAQQPNGWWTFTYPEKEQRQFHNWASWFLAAEDEEESCLGRTRSMMRAGTLSRVKASPMISIATHIAVLWNQYLEKATLSTWEYLRDIQGLEEFQRLGVAGHTHWTWAGIQLAAEGKRSSLAFAIEVLATEGVMEPKEAEKFIKYLFDWAVQWRHFSPSDERRDQQLRLMKIDLYEKLVALYSFEPGASTPVEAYASRAERRAAKRRLAKEQRRDQNTEKSGESLASFACLALAKRQNPAQAVRSSGSVEQPEDKPQKTTKQGKKSLASHRDALGKNEDSLPSASPTEATDLHHQDASQDGEASAFPGAKDHAKQTEPQRHKRSTGQRILADVEQGDGVGDSEEADTEIELNTRKARKARRQALKRQAERREKYLKIHQPKRKERAGRSNGKFPNEKNELQKNADTPEPLGQDVAHSSADGPVVPSPIPPSLEGVIEKMAKKAAPPPGVDPRSPLPLDLTSSDVDTKSIIVGDTKHYDCNDPLFVYGTPQSSTSPLQIAEIVETTEPNGGPDQIQSPKPRSPRYIDLVDRLQRIAETSAKSTPVDGPLKIQSPKPRSPCSSDLSERLEHIAMAAEDTDDTSGAALTHGNRPDTGICSVTDTKPVSSLSWQEMGFAAEERNESLFGRARQLVLMGALSGHEADNILSIGMKVAKAWRTFSKDRVSHPEIWAPSNDWQWSDLQLDAEDRQDSIFGALRIMKSMGCYDNGFDEKVHNLGTDIAKRWLIASSVPELDEGTLKQRPCSTLRASPALDTRRGAVVSHASLAPRKSIADPDRIQVLKQQRAMSPFCAQGAFDWQLSSLRRVLPAPQ